MSFEGPSQKNELVMPDFQAIFQERLRAIPEIPEEKRKQLAEGFKSIGIKELKREMPGVFFSFDTEKGELVFGLWVLDPSKISSRVGPHNKVRSDLFEFLKIEERDFNKHVIDRPSSMTILQDEKDQLYILLDKHNATYISSSMNALIERKWLNALLDSLKKYKISNIVVYSQQKEPKIISDQDLIGDRREDLWLHGFASKHNMTIAQYLRFRIRVKSATDAMKKGKQIPIDIDKIAQEIVDEDRG